MLKTFPKTYHMKNAKIKHKAKNIKFLEL